MLYKILLMIILSSLSCASLAKESHVIPRFASIKSGEANLRKGPGPEYPTIFIYKHKMYPVEIIAEYEQWRKVRDIEGDEGWIHTSILSSKRTVIVKTSSAIALYKSDDLKSKIIAKLENNLVCHLKKCKNSWCKINCRDYTGWVGRDNLWGVYVGEDV